MGRRCIPFEQRFWAKVIRRSDDECWSWTGSKYRHPLTGEPTYGTISMDHRKMGAHRASWIYHFGEIPEGMEVMHSCDNPECTNPKHLKLGTHAENMEDMRCKGRLISPPGERCGHARLTNAQVLEIKRLLKQGMKHREIARRFGVGQVAITAINRGVNWRSVMLDPDEYLHWRPKYREMHLASLQNKSR